MLIDDKANIIIKDCFIFNPYSPEIIWARYIMLIIYMLGFILVFWEFAFFESKELFLAFCNWYQFIKVGFSILESSSNYFIGVYIDEMYIENKWRIAQ